MSALEVQLARDRRSAAGARRWLEQHVPADLDGDTLDHLKLAATELVENALVHGEGAITLRLEVRGDAIRIEVTDEGENAAIKIREQGPELGGWGLVLVDRLAERWGAYEGTTHVWADFRVRSRD